MTDTIFNNANRVPVSSPFGTPRSDASSNLTGSATKLGLGNGTFTRPTPNPVASSTAPATSSGTQTALITPTTPAANTVKFSEVTMDTLVRQLLNLPAEIGQWQADFDATDRAYKAQLAETTIRAFSAPLFPCKKEGEGNRPASNDTEREAAVAQLVATDGKSITLATEREAALRMLQQVKNQFEAVKIAAQLLISAGK